MVSHNIILTYRCLNRCPYCFSSKTRQSADGPILKKEELLYYIRLLKESDVREARFLGGEPFLHPDIRDFVEIVLGDPWFEGLTIFTTGFVGPEYHELLCSDRVKLVANINEPSDYEGNKFSVLKRRLFRLADLPVNIVPGYNIYKEDFDYHPIIELAQELGSRTLRWTIAVPSSGKGTKCLDLSGKKRASVRILEFLNDCIAAHIEPSLDCPVEPCVFTREQLGQFAQLCPRCVSRLGRCHPVLDLGPGYRAQRCFAAQELLSQDIRDHDSLESLDSFYKNALDRYRPYSVDDECRECAHLRAGNCLGGCVAANADRLRINLAEIKRVSEVLRKSKSLCRDKQYERVIEVLEPVLERARVPGAIEEYANALFQSGRKREFMDCMERELHHFLVLKTYRSYLLLTHYNQSKGNVHAALGHLRQCLRRTPPANRPIVKDMIQKLQISRSRRADG